MVKQEMENIGKDVTEPLSHKKQAKHGRRSQSLTSSSRICLRAFSSSFLCLDLALSEGSQKRIIVLLLKIVSGVSRRRMVAYLFFFLWGL